MAQQTNGNIQNNEDVDLLNKYPTLNWISEFYKYMSVIATLSVAVLGVMQMEIGKEML